jgi:hypothetical protein
MAQTCIRLYRALVHLWARLESRDSMAPCELTPNSNAEAANLTFFNDSCLATLTSA